MLFDPSTPGNTSAVDCLPIGFCGTFSHNQLGELFNIKVLVNHEQPVAIHLMPSTRFKCQLLYALVHKKYAVIKPTANAMTLTYSITTEYNPALSTISSKFFIHYSASS
jgi:hypothetical protein